MGFREGTSEGTGDQQSRPPLGRVRAEGSRELGQKLAEEVESREGFDLFFGMGKYQHVCKAGGPIPQSGKRFQYRKEKGEMMK